MRRVRVLTGDARLVCPLHRRQRVKVRHVDALSSSVGRRQDNVRVTLAQRADRVRSLVEHLEILFRRVPVANAVEDVQEGLFALAVHSLQLEQRNAGAFIERWHLKEERAAKLALEVFGNVALDDRRQLMQIAEQQQPHAAERFARASAIDAQRLVDRPHEVGAHHRDLVDDDQLQLAHDAAVAAAPDVIGADEARRKAEERVDGLTAHIYRREPGRSQHNCFVDDMIAQSAQQRRFSRAGASGDEQVPFVMANELNRAEEFWWRRDACRPGHLGNVGSVSQLGEFVAGHVASLRFARD